MGMMSWEIEPGNGFWLPQIGWRLDAWRPSARSFVSHAHSDHAAAHREVICTAATARLLQARIPGARIEHILPFGHAEQLTDEASITLHPASHVLGSAQCLIEHRRLGSLLYTGDFRLEAGSAAEACACPAADVLIMETTFGMPRYVFPPTAKVMEDLKAFCRSAIAEGCVPVLYAYSLGKSQELMLGLGPAGFEFVLAPATLRITQAYESLGVRFPCYLPFTPMEAAGRVLICPPPPGSAALLNALPRRRTAFVSGWALDRSAIYRTGADAAFPLSDHAGFPDLLKFVDRVRPKLVYTVHGFAREFASALRSRGYEAWALGTDNQLDLGLT